MLAVTGSGSINGSGVVVYEAGHDYVGQGDDLGGITYPITFERNKTAPRVYCWWNLTIRNSRYDLYQDTKMVCR